MALLIDALFALVLAAILAVLLTGALSWRHPRHPAGYGLAVLFLLLILFPALWAAAAWMPEAGPTYQGVNWLAVLLVGLLLAVMIAAATGPSRAARIADAATETERAAAAGAVFGLFFWVLMLMLIAAIVAGYL